MIGIEIPRKNRSRRYRGALGAVTALAIGFATMAGNAAETVPVRFAYLGVNTANIYFAFGVENGIFERHGIDLDIITFQRGGPEIIAAAASQQVDMGVLGTPVLAGISRGFPIKVVGAPALKGQEFVLVGRPDITSIDQLVGQNVGVAAVGGGQAQALQIILRAEEIDPKTVGSIAYGSPGNGYVSLKSGQLAGAILSEPNISRLVVEGSGTILAEAKDYYGRYQHSYIFSTDAFIEAHPDTLKAFFEASAEAIQYSLDHRAELLDFAEQTLDIERPTLEAVLERQLAEWDPSQQIDEEGLLNAVAIVQSAGDIDADYQPDLEAIIDRRFIPNTENSND